MQFLRQESACNAASVLWLPFRAYTFLIRLGFAHSDSTSPLADLSLLLLLALINHSPQLANVQHKPAQSQSQNPFRAAMQALQDSEDVGTDAESVQGRRAAGACAVPFSQLYDALGAGLHREPSVLLLYVLLHKWHRFQQYVLVRSDADTILVPLLQRWEPALILKHNCFAQCHLQQQTHTEQLCLQQQPHTQHYMLQTSLHSIKWHISATADNKTLPSADQFCAQTASHFPIAQFGTVLVQSTASLRLSFVTLLPETSSYLFSWGETQPWLASLQKPVSMLLAKPAASWLASLHACLGLQRSSIPPCNMNCSTMGRRLESRWDLMMGCRDQGGGGEGHQS